MLIKSTCKFIELLALKVLATLNDAPVAAAAVVTAVAIDLSIVFAVAS